MAKSVRILTFLGTAALAAALAGPALAGQKIDITFNADDFDDPLTIDNPYWPLVPGTTYTYAAGGDDECELDVFMVTNEVEVILGVQTRVVQDDAYIDENCNGVLDAGEPQAETTKDWHAQDDDGNVWYFGEDTRECDEGGCNDPAGSWKAGENGALPGIFILAEPHPGDQHFQEIAEDEAEDQVKYLRLKVWVSLYRDDAVPPGEFHRCWETKEWTKLDPGHVEHKFYCPRRNGAFEGGLVAVDELKGKTVRFELVDIVTP
jgi:hypothetical protein